MNITVVISCLLAASACADFVGVPHVTTTQYHSQDGLGQYSYGYTGGPSSKQEIKSSDGVTRGSYSYIDANGILQSASYVADPVNGFRVSATNLPKAPSPLAPTASGFDYVHGVPLETSEVAAAKAAHFAAHNEALARLAGRWKRSLAPTGSYSYVTPSGGTTVVAGSPSSRAFSYSTIASAPLSAPVGRSYAAPVPAVHTPMISQYQSQDELGQYTYGYSDGLSSKTESRTADGATHGTYTYLDSNGIVQRVNYVADAGGFRVSATNLPVGPTV